MLKDVFLFSLKNLVLFVSLSLTSGLKFKREVTEIINRSCDWIWVQSEVCQSERKLKQNYFYPQTHKLDEVNSLNIMRSQGDSALL